MSKCTFCAKGGRGETILGDLCLCHISPSEASAAPLSSWCPSSGKPVRNSGMKIMSYACLSAKLFCLHVTPRHRPNCQKENNILITTFTSHQCLKSQSVMNKVHKNIRPTSATTKSAKRKAKLLRRFGRAAITRCSRVRHISVHVQILCVVLSHARLRYLWFIQLLAAA